MKLKNIVKSKFLFLLIFIPFVLGYITVTQSKNCEKLVIDTYEIHSNIDIPASDNSGCYYDAKKDIRISVFELRDEAEDFIKSNKLKRLTQPFSQTVLKGYNLLAKEQRPQSRHLYKKSGMLWGNKWSYLVDKKSGRLWVELAYN